VQASIIALSPVLAEVAADFNVSTAAAGQLRTASGLVAGLVALGMGRLSARLGLRELLLTGLGILGFASLLSAAAPSFAVLAVAQVALGAGLAIVLSAGLAAAADWAVPPSEAVSGPEHAHPQYPSLIEEPFRGSRPLSWTGPPSCYLDLRKSRGIHGEASRGLEKAHPGCSDGRRSSSSHPFRPGQTLA
jgi:hypothetical protein